MNTSAGVPKNIRHAIDRYVLQGIPPGDCTRAILAGDLFAAFSRADPMTTAAMAAIVWYVQTELPPGCWGSYELVDEWILTYRGARAVTS